ncbi:MAG: phosphate transport system substrate-binding protein [Actinomycetota bacterium]|nr:phosphate transport system substrate-binding protein [Actinomycetota bacterium]
MHVKKTRIIKSLAFSVVLALAAGACGGDDETTSSGGSGGTDKTPLSATLKGSGATFPKAFYEVAIASYGEEQPGVTIEYAGGGSGTGRQQLQDQLVDFAGSDGLVKAEDVPKYKGGEFLYVPTVAAPITVSYNLSDVKDLVLDADTIAKIFQRQITKWDDDAIKALNSGVSLPSTDIVVAHRSDGSGTTENFTKYLVAAAPTTWTLKSGSTVEWPADTQAGNGNAGVAAIVKDSVGAIGYVDLSDAKATGLQFATIKNRAGKAVKPTLEGASAALAGATINPDLSYNPLNADGDGAYPITAPTWILVYKNQTDKAKGDAIKSFLTYILTDGQDLANPVDYAELPDALKTKALAQLDNIVVPVA